MPRLFSTSPNFDGRKQYLNDLFPEDRAMKDRKPEEWVEIAVQNGFPYEQGDCEAKRFWYRDTMRAMRRKLRTDGVLWFPEGHLHCQTQFIPHKNKFTETP